MSTDGVAAYYDRLGRWNRFARAFGYGGGQSSLTVHRYLADPRVDGRATPTRLHDVLLDALPPLASPRVLDAGCGLGGTMVELAARLGASCTGLTLSQTQAETANAAFSRLGIADRVRALVRSYDNPPEGPYDLIVAIESLAHSPDPARSVAALASVLAPGGVLAVVDDMPEPAALGTPDFATFVEGWQSANLWSAAQYADGFERHGLVLLRSLDLSSQCRPRTMRRAAQLMWLNRLVVRVVPSLRAVMDSHMGGLALERLTRAGLVRYRLLIAGRPGLQVS